MDVQNKQTITIDMRRKSVVPVPYFTQNDTNVLEFIIKNNGADADLSQIERINAVYKRPDGIDLSRLLDNVNNIVTYELGAEEMAVPGFGDLELQFFAGSQRLTTLKLKVYFRESLGPHFENGSGYPMLQSLFLEVAEASETVTDAGNFAMEKASEAEQAKTAALEAADSVRTNWLQEVGTVAERDTTYPAPQKGDTVRITSEARIDRFNGTQWVTTDRYNPAAIDQVNQQLAEKVKKTDIQKTVKTKTFNAGNSSSQRRAGGNLNIGGSHQAKPMAVIEYDDGLKDVWTVIFPAHLAAGAPGVSAINPQAIIDGRSTHLTIQQCRDLYASGLWEFTLHGTRHASLELFKTTADMAAGTTILAINSQRFDRFPIGYKYLVSDGTNKEIVEIAGNSGSVTIKAPLVNSYALGAEIRLSDESLHHEVAEGKRLVEEVIGVPCIGYTYPYNAHAAFSRKFVAKYFSHARSGSTFNAGEAGKPATAGPYNPQPELAPFVLSHALYSELWPVRTDEQLTTWITKTRDDKLFSVFYSHDTATTEVNRIINLCRNNGVEIASWEEVWKYHGNLVEVGDTFSNLPIARMSDKENGAFSIARDGTIAFKVAPSNLSPKPSTVTALAPGATQKWQIGPFGRGLYVLYATAQYSGYETSWIMEIGASQQGVTLNTRLLRNGSIGGFHTAEANWSIVRLSATTLELTYTNTAANNTLEHNVNVAISGSIHTAATINKI